MAAKQAGMYTLIRQYVIANAGTMYDDAEAALQWQLSIHDLGSTGWSRDHALANSCSQCKPGIHMRALSVTLGQNCWLVGGRKYGAECDAIVGSCSLSRQIDACISAMIDLLARPPAGASLPGCSTLTASNEPFPCT
jgi:hypothetical protein